MTAYIVAIRRNVHDPKGMATYIGILQKNFPNGLGAMVQNGRCEALEGAPAEAMVILPFETMDAAKAFYKSPAYQEALPHRLASANYDSYIVEDVG